ncbi:DUF3124 domain-containing protein [Dokdonia genika]|uniref:DUF3124 domain-containing protein n=1 Tax=Dokdonia genika TaxID=308113 RepID=A0ABV9L985_9FLAO
MKTSAVQVICTLVLALSVISCNEQPQVSSVNPENWGARTARIPTSDTLAVGKTYLSIYSQIFSYSEHKTHNLTAMVSLRNTSDTDTIYITNASYYDTHGKLVRTYFDNAIYLSPLETTEIVIDEKDVTGGTGSNFIFEWSMPAGASEPLFEGVMSSTMGQQGLSFTTQGKRIK